MEDNIINWSLFLIRNLDAKVNGKTYKKHNQDWVRELYRQWESNVDIDKKLMIEEISLTNRTHFLGVDWKINVIKEDNDGVLISSPNGDTQWLSHIEWETYKINKNKKHD